MVVLLLIVTVFPEIDTMRVLEGIPTAFTYAPTTGAVPLTYVRVADAEVHVARNPRVVAAAMVAC